MLVITFMRVTEKEKRHTQGTTTKKGKKTKEDSGNKKKTTWKPKNGK